MAKRPGRVVAEDRLVHNIYGNSPSSESVVISSVVLHTCFSICTKCGKFLPLSEFGLLTDKSSCTVRNQPRCRACRSEKEPSR